MKNTLGNSTSEANAMCQTDGLLQQDRCGAILTLNENNFKSGLLYHKCLGEA
jgi:hypothetical protein